MTFYTEERMKNWVDRINEQELDFESAESFEVFDKMIEDFVVACMYLIRSVKDREIPKKDALMELEEVSKIFEKKFSFNDQFKREFFEFSRESMRTILAASKLYLEGKVSKKDFKTLLEEAVKKEKEGDLDSAFELVAKMGAKILAGEKLPELDAPDDEFVVLNWLDGVDAINTVVLLSEIDASEIEEED
ncbi:DUF2150 domain-containing protein [Archaeoglobales archaeon]|nr:MAG: DUF2150 domain-containing protein [Archaeoglobales archaeon]